MASNILVIPFRRTHSVSISEGLKQYISSKYDQHPDMFAQDLEEIDRLRASAVNASTPVASGITHLLAYSAQLVWLSGKFPVDVGTDFTWYPALGYNTETAQTTNSLRFELANVRFNLIAMYCQLAVNSNRSTSDGLKIASNYFCQGAGVISHLKSQIIPEMNTKLPEDMDVMTLESLEQLLLAQAQECFWQRAVKDGLKDLSIAKLAATVSDYYARAADFGIKSDAISSQWIHHMTAKHHHFAAAAQFRAACDCLEKRKYGEEVARLQDSLLCVNEALKESRYINKTVLGDLNGLKTKVQDDLKRAEKDNDKIYLNVVPPKSELKTIDRAGMVSSKIPKEVVDPVSLLGDNAELGRLLFNKLVPYSVHIAASIYADRRDKTIASLVDDLEGLNTRIHELLKSLNLPGSLQALEKPLGIPSGLISHAEEIRQRNGLDRLYRGMDDVEKLKTNDRITLQEAVGFLQSEANEDDQARHKYGTDRWTRAESKQAGSTLYDQVTELEGYMNSAEASDQKVRAQLKTSEPLIQILSGTDRDLENHVPSSRRATLTPKVEREVTRLRHSLDDVSRLESRRKRKIETLKAKGQADDVSTEILREASRLEREFPMQNINATQFDALFAARLKRYEPDQNIVTEEKREQERLLSSVAEANAAFQTARRGDSSTKDREQALQRLENGYFEYKELVQNLDVGRKFYNELATIVSKFRDDCRTFAYQRRSEAAQLEADIMMVLPIANLSLNQAPPQTTPANPQGPGYAGQRRGDSIAAPRPVAPGIWQESAGIRFAGVTTPGTGQGQGSNSNTGASGGEHKDTGWDPSKPLRFG